MSTTVVHPESVSGHGPSGKTIGMAVAGLVLAASLGFAFANQSTPEVGAATSEDTAQAALQIAALREATSGVPQGIVGMQLTSADLIAHAESLAGELQALRGASEPTSQAVPWAEFVNGTPRTQAVPWAQFVNGTSVANEAQENEYPAGIERSPGIR